VGLDWGVQGPPGPPLGYAYGIGGPTGHAQGEYMGRPSRGNLTISKHDVYLLRETFPLQNIYKAVGYIREQNTKQLIKCGDDGHRPLSTQVVVVVVVAVVLPISYLFVTVIICSHPS